MAACPSTEDMVAVTPTRMYVLYPELLHRGIATLGHGIFPSEYVSRVPTTAVLDSEYWPFSCGKACPSIWRKGREGEGTGVIYWNSRRERAIISSIRRSIGREHATWGVGGGRWSDPKAEVMPWDDAGLASWEARMLAWEGHTSRESQRRVAIALNEGGLLNQSDIKWRLKQTCRNPRCPLYQPDVQLEE